MEGPVAPNPGNNANANQNNDTGNNDNNTPAGPNAPSSKPTCS